MLDNKSNFMKFAHHFWEQQDSSVIDCYVAKDCIIHTPLTQSYGSMTLKQIADKWFEAFPDLLLFFRNCVAEDDQVVCRWRAKGTHLGSFFETQPTHQEVSFVGVTMCRYHEGLIQEYWSLIDVHSILKQLGGVRSISEVVD
ncbi:MAG: hypothetical protein CL816_03780 [Coxiellaceae bacterium]|nr:hypothetical protein [Coxiellaceae bacterium]|tara:strand:- start:3057 stop:3482 length:426 start_codon:yes stop_codon:yes gene_type:complete